MVQGRDYNRHVPVSRSNQKAELCVGTRSFREECTGVTVFRSPQDTKFVVGTTDCRFYRVACHKRVRCSVLVTSDCIPAFVLELTDTGSLEGKPFRFNAITATDNDFQAFFRE